MGETFLRREITWGLALRKRTSHCSYILDSINTIGGGVPLMVPCRCLKTQGVNTKSETNCTANDITRQVEKHVSEKDVRQMSDHGPFGRKSTPGVERLLLCSLG